MSISVCIATYNGSIYIEEQIRSILNQLSQEDNIIISDDNSIDNTINIIKQIDDTRINIYYNEGEKGYTSNFENALKHANGDIIFLADQDDVWIEGKVSATLAQLKKYQFVVTDANVVDSELNILYESHFNLTSVRTGFIRNFLKTRYIGACMAFRRYVLDKALPFPKNHSLCAHDYWLAIVSELYFNVGLIKTPYLKYRRHTNNASNGGLNKSNVSILNRLYKRFYCGYYLIKILFSKGKFNE